MPPTMIRAWRGHVVLKKISGTAGSGVTVGQEILVPNVVARPRNPKNISYVPMISGTSYTSVAVQGKKTPSVSLTACVKTGSGAWFNKALLDALILNVDGTTQLTDEWAVILHNGTGARYYTHARCAQIRLTQGAMNGPIMAEMAFLSVYGDSDDPSPPTYTPPVAAVAGQLTNVSQVDFKNAALTNTADGVNQWVLNMMRLQRHVGWAEEGVLYANSVQSGAFGGSLTLNQTAGFTLTPGSTASVRIDPTNVGFGTRLDMLVNNDEDIQDQEPSFQDKVRQFTLADLSAGAATVTATTL